MSRLGKVGSFLLIAGLAIPLLWALLHPGFFVSDDGEWMIIRLAAFTQTLRTGQFPVRFLETLNHGYGYPVTNFLYPLPFYLGAVFHFLGISFINSVKLLLTLDILGGAIFVFLFLKERFKTMAATVGAVAFLSHPYVIFDLYKRGSLGELTALMFAAATVLFLVKFLKTSKGIFFSLGAFFWAATILSHNTVGLISVPVIFGLTLLLKEAVLPKDVFKIMAAFGMALLVAAFFWIPAIGEYGYTRAPQTVVANFRDYFLRPVELVLLIGLPILIIGAVSFWQLFSKGSGWLARISLLVFILAIFLASPLSTVLWEHLPLGRIVQFPWRFISVIALVAPVIVAGVVKTKKMTVAVWLILLAGYFFSLSQSNIQYLNRDDAYYETNDDTTTVKGEYLTKYVKNPPTNAPRDKIEIIKGTGEVSGKTINFKTPGVVRINEMYYPGLLLQVDGETIDYDYKASGFVEASLEPGKHRLRTNFSETPLRFFADSLSVVGIIVLLMIGFAPRRVVSIFGVS